VRVDEMANIVKCPKCKSLMIKTGSKYRCQSKGCGHEAPVCDLTVTTVQDRTITNKVFDAKTAAEDKGMMVLDGKAAATLPVDKTECPKCHHNEAYWVLRQTRAADEPETKIYRCTKCEHSWREY
jgi:DNA-directed RNA polymerase subunit M